MTKYKYQEQFAADLTENWLNGNKSDVRTKIRNLKNKAQSAYIAAMIVKNLMMFDSCSPESCNNALSFIAFIHPNNQ